MVRAHRLSYNSNKFSIKLDTLLLLFIALLLFLWSNGYNLRIFDVSDRFDLFQLVGLFTILAASCYRFLTTPLNFFIQNTYFRFIIAMLVVIYLPTFIYLGVVNGISLTNVFISGVLYPGLFIFIILISYRTSPRFVSRLNNLLFGTTTLYVLFLIIMAASPELADIILVKTSDRFGQIRISISHGLESIAHYAFCYLLVQVAKKQPSFKLNLFYIFNVFIYMWFFLTISMGRRTILTFFILTIYFWLFHMSTLRKTRTTIAYLLFAIILSFTPQANKAITGGALSYTTSVEDYQSNTGTVGVRIDGMRYYLKMFRETNYLGIGLYSNKLPLGDPYQIGKTWFHYHYGDHGIVAVFYRFGFPGIILTIFILLCMFKDLSLIRQKGPKRDQEIAMAIHLYLLFSLFGFLQIYWKDSISFWTGTIFFMVWKMKKNIIDSRRAENKKLDIVSNYKTNLTP